MWRKQILKTCRWVRKVWIKMWEKCAEKNVGKGVITSDKQSWQHILLVCGKIIVGKQISADNFIGL